MITVGRRTVRLLEDSKIMSTSPHNRQGFILTWDLTLTRQMNRLLSRKGIQPFFAAISWLGNGKFWYTLMAVFPFLVADGMKATLHMVLAGAVNLIIYKLAKSRLRRPRPCNAFEEIQRGAAPLDEFSFPSGHTMHAVAFTMIALAWCPQLTVPLIVFAVLTGLSRVILGLHYPTDVVLGALLGAITAELSFRFLNIPWQSLT